MIYVLHYPQDPKLWKFKNLGIFLAMANAGFISSTVIMRVLGFGVEGLGFRVKAASAEKNLIFFRP